MYQKAASGFEPENRGFADLCLTTWLSRHSPNYSGISFVKNIMPKYFGKRNIDPTPKSVKEKP
jgi:hypothetical protein